MYIIIEVLLFSEDTAGAIVGFFIAGYETSSSALAFCLYELARNTDVQIKLQRELDDTRLLLTRCYRSCPTWTTLFLVRAIN